VRQSSFASSTSLLCLLVSAVILGCPACAARAAQAGQARESAPNFVFILIDDMGWRDLGCFGSTFHETPNIDRLARQGVRFTSAYAACNVCSPTRASLLTGKYPPRTGITDWIPGNRRPQKMLPAEMRDSLSHDEVTLAEALKDAGYATAFVGKWHLGRTDRREGPDLQGFDVNVGGSHYGTPPSYFSQYRNPWIDDGPEGEYLTDRLGEEAAKFIKAKKDKPFLVYLSHYGVHNPQRAKQALIDKYKAKAMNLPHANTPEFITDHGRQVRQQQDRPVYAAMVESVDDSVGRVMKALEDAGVAERTVVVFTTDNGGLSTAEGSPTSNVPLRTGKGWPYEGGVRVPLIVKWPGAVKPGTTCDVPVVSPDVYPTFLEMAGLPPRPRQHVDGLSLVPLLKGEKQSLDRDAIYWHYPHTSNQGGGPHGAVRAGDWKLIEWYEDGGIELYNLKDDLGEQDDLSEKMPERAADLKEKLHAWRKSVHAKMPKPNPDFVERP